MNSPLHRDIGADFGAVPADGESALAYRRGNIDPYIEQSEKIVLDFSGVRTSNSSFVNALVAGIVERHGEAVLHKLVFKGCKPSLRVLVESAIQLGLRKNGDLIAA